MTIPTETSALYAEFGATAEMAQVLEVEAGNYVLAYLSFCLRPGEVTNEQREFLQEALASINHSTFGKLLTLIKKSATFDKDLIDTVDRALDRRNHLMHHFFRSHNLAIRSEQGREAMIEELKSIRNDLTLAHAMLSASTASLLRVTGWDGIVDEHSKRLAEEVKRIQI